MSEQEVRVQVWRGKGKEAPKPDTYEMQVPKWEPKPHVDFPPPPVDRGSPPPDKKYVGDVATGYDDKRRGQPRWHEEQEIIEGILDAYPPGSLVLDVPIGTGRFLPFYQRKKFTIVGIDVSVDMLNEAHKQLEPGSINCSLYAGDIRKLDDSGLPDKMFEVAVMCRMTRWLSPNEIVGVMRELGRLTKREIILTARVADHPHARPVKMFTDALPGWGALSVAVKSDPNYHVIRMQPTTEVGSMPAAPQVMSQEVEDDD
jgi:SAM-dependent methyltransferase